MAAVTICSAFGAPKNKVSHCFHCFPIYLPWSDGTRIDMKWWDQKTFLVFWMLSFKPNFSLSSFTFIKRLFSSSSLSAIRVVSSAYLRWLIFLPAILIPACASSSPAFLMMYSPYKLNKQGENIQPWRTPFPIWKQSVVPCPVLTVACWPAYRFLKRQVRWSSIPISFRVFHSLLWSTQSKALAYFLEISCFCNDPANVGNLISGSSAFFKTSLNIWKFTVHVLLKPGLGPRLTLISSLKALSPNTTTSRVTALTQEFSENITQFLIRGIKFGWASLTAQQVKDLPAMQMTRVQSMVWENPLEKEMATYSSILAWEIPRTEEPGGLQSMDVT